MRELSPGELDGQVLELLPPRETLDTYVNFADVDAANVALALNYDSEDAEAWAAAVQLVGVDQSF